MPPLILFLKAELVRQHVQVKPHERGGKLVRPYLAVRMKQVAPAEPIKPYSGYRLPADERQRLLALFPPAYPVVRADHITHSYPVAPDSPPPARPASARIVGRADDGHGIEALVLEIDGSLRRPDGGIWHITWSKLPARESRESNDAIAAGWVPLQTAVPVVSLQPVVHGAPKRPPLIKPFGRSE